MKIMGHIQALPTMRIFSLRLIPQVFVLLRSFYFDQCVFAQPQNRVHRQCEPPPDDPNDFIRGKIYSNLNNVYWFDNLRDIHNNSYQWYDLCISADNGCCKNLKVDGCLANDYVHALGSYTTSAIIPPSNGIKRYHYSSYNTGNYISYEDNDLDSKGDWIVI